MRTYDRKGILFLLVLLAFLSGSLHRLDLSFQFFRTRDLQVLPNHPEFEAHIWNVIDGRQVRFWPILLKERQVVIAEIENRFPVKMRFRLRGFGSVLFQAEPLSAWSVIKWKGHDWFIEPEGLIWSTTAKGNVIIDVPDMTEIPSWKVGETLGTPFNGGDEIDPSTDNMIRTSNLPITSMIEWWGKIESLSWADLIYQIEINRVAAEYELTFSILAGATRVFLKVKAEDQHWLELDDAIRQIMPDFPFTGKNMEIDATFRNRIVVREL